MRKKYFFLVPMFSLAIISSEKMHVKRFFFLSILGSIKACVLFVLRSNMVPVACRIQFGLLVLTRIVDGNLDSGESGNNDAVQRYLGKLPFWFSS
jgi:lipid-A-disaccharide synthase-like uncharacterized protein